MDKNDEIERFIGDKMGEYMTQSLKRGGTQKANKITPVKLLHRRR